MFRVVATVFFITMGKKLLSPVGIHLSRRRSGAEKITPKGDTKLCFASGIWLLVQLLWLDAVYGDTLETTLEREDSAEPDGEPEILERLRHIQWTSEGGQ